MKAMQLKRFGLIEESPLEYVDIRIETILLPEFCILL